MNCIKCGKLLAPNENICTNCGEPVNNINMNQGTINQTPNVMVQPNYMPNQNNMMNNQGFPNNQMQQIPQSQVQIDAMSSVQPPAPPKQTKSSKDLILNIVIVVLSIVAGIVLFMLFK